VLEVRGGDGLALEARDDLARRAQRAVQDLDGDALLPSGAIPNAIPAAWSMRPACG
jgi:hypothetical protein